MVKKVIILLVSIATVAYLISIVVMKREKSETNQEKSSTSAIQEQTQEKDNDNDQKKTETIVIPATIRQVIGTVEYVSSDKGEQVISVKTKEGKIVKTEIDEKTFIYELKNNNPETKTIGDIRKGMDISIQYDEESDNAATSIMINGHWKQI